jgi:hypothetical protein
MAFSYTVDKVIQGLNGRSVVGTYTSAGGSTGGDIYTGLTNIYAISLQPKGSSILANQPVVNETLPMATDGITIVTTAHEVGTFVAFGE